MDIETARSMGTQFTQYYYTKFDSNPVEVADLLVVSISKLHAFNHS